MIFYITGMKLLHNIMNHDDDPRHISCSSDGHEPSLDNDTLSGHYCEYSWKRNILVEIAQGADGRRKRIAQIST